MKKIIIYAVFAILLIADVVVTAVVGLNASMTYGEGYTISFTEEGNIDINDVKQIATEVFGKDVLVQNMEFFNDSAKIKVKEVSDEQVQEFCNKINEKYSSEKEVADFKVEHVSNVKLRTLVEPYIAPVGISLLLVLTCYAIIFRGTKQMINLIKWVVGTGIVMYSLHALARIPVNIYTVPVFMCAYGLIIIAVSTYYENNKEKEISE